MTPEPDNGAAALNDFPVDAAVAQSDFWLDIETDVPSNTDTFLENSTAGAPVVTAAAGASSTTAVPLSQSATSQDLEAAIMGDAEAGVSSAQAHNLSPGELPSEPADSLNLIQFCLEDNSLEGALPAGLLDSMKNLEELWLVKNKI